MTTSLPPPAYYLIESNGGVRNLGLAPFYGSKASSRSLPGPIVASALTPDGAGYWLAGQTGAVYQFGDAQFYGSAVHIKAAKPIVAFAPTSDGQGYWLIGKNGHVFNYGDAPFCGSPVHEKAPHTIAGFAPTPDGLGYWMVATNGSVFNYGDAKFFGSAARAIKPKAITAFAPTADGLGYWIVGGSGRIYNFGDAAFFGSGVHIKLPAPITSIAATADDKGYWIVGSSGRIYNFGDAKFAGSLAKHPPPEGITVVDIVRSNPVPADVPSIPHNVFGYDISNFQCLKRGSSKISTKLPATSKLTIIEAAGWLDGANNSCLQAEANWASAAAGTTGASYELYLFLNAPGTNAPAKTLSGTGPAGTCTSEPAGNQNACKAYNYGYNGASAAYNYASSQSVQSVIWWVDIENALLSKTANSNLSAGAYWSNSTALNDATIEGAIDALRKAGAKVGIYSTSVQFAKIAGSYIPTGQTTPLWIAGAPWTNPPYVQPSLPGVSALDQWCAGTAFYTNPKANVEFAGGVPWLLQETPGTLASPSNLDPDFSC